MSAVTKQSLLYMSPACMREAELPELSGSDVARVLAKNPAAVDILPLGVMDSFDITYVLMNVPSLVSFMDLDKLDGYNRQLLARHHNELSEILAINE